MERRDAEALDRHITGNYGEDQERDWWDPSWDEPATCQVSNCEEDAVDGVLCAKHSEEASDGA